MRWLAGSSRPSLRVGFPVETTSDGVTLSCGDRESQPSWPSTTRLAYDKARSLRFQRGIELTGAPSFARDRVFGARWMELVCY